MLKVPGNLKEHSTKIVKDVIVVVIILIALFVVFGFLSISQNPTPKNTPLPIKPIPFPMADSSVLQQERKNTAVIFKQTDTFIKSVRKEVITELKATKDSLKIMKIIDSLPILLADQ
jgi:uncharacterized membrane protein